MSTRRLPALLGVWAALLLLVAIAPAAPAALAVDPSGDPGPATVEVDLDTEPLVPYIAALVVTSAVLIVVGFVAMQVNRRPTPGARRRDPGTWWACPSCATSNADDRDTCFACAAPRTPSTG
jgi:hypothetical protein